MTDSNVLVNVRKVVLTRNGTMAAKSAKIGERMLMERRNYLHVCR